MSNCRIRNHFLVAVVHIHILLALVGLGAAGLLRTTPALFMVVKYAGAAYLSWVGLQLIWAAFKKWRSPAVPTAELQEVPAHMAHPFKRALLVSLLIPKAILFLLSFFVQFMLYDALSH